jgi:hypothetical protein
MRLIDWPKKARTLMDDTGTVQVHMKRILRTNSGTLVRTLVDNTVQEQLKTILMTNTLVSTLLDDMVHVQKILMMTTTTKTTNFEF